MTSTTRSFEAAPARRAGGAWAGAAWAALRHAAGWPGRVYRARAMMHVLSRMDGHELRDIGLTPQDLRDAGSNLFDPDPSLVLRRRVDERRRRG